MHPERSGTLIDQPILYPISATPLQRQAVLIAEAEFRRGVKEDPPGSNSGIDVAAYQIGIWKDGIGYLEGQRWCARFWRYCYERAAKELGLFKPFVNWREAANKPPSDLASSSKIYDCARYGGHLITEPEFACAGLFLSPNHVAMVVGIQLPYLVTIEGNFKDRVAMVLRKRGDFQGFARVAS